METQQLRLKKSKRQDRLSVKKSLIIGSLIATFIAATPYLFYLYEGIPDGRIWDTFLFTYQVKHFEDANYFFWIVTGKAIPLILLTIWFFTCRHWWYHTLLVPISMYIYQIVGLFNDDNKFVDEYQLLYLLPVIAIVIPSIYLIRARIFNKLNSVDKSMQDLEDEFKIQPKGFWGSIKQYF